LIAALGGIAILASAAPAQTGPTDGAQQAAAGAKIYAGQCAACHGDALEGGAGPALNDAAYQAQWNGHPARELYDRIIDTMPADNPGSLKPDETIALAMFLQKANGGQVPAKAITDPDGLKAVTLSK